MHPIVEAEISLLPNTGIDANRKNDETNHRQYLDTREPELKLAVEVDRKEIQRGDQYPEHADEY